MKKLFAAAIALALIGFACWLILASRANKPPAWVKLPDGNSIRIVGATYGTEHFLGTPLARATAHMPALLQDFMTKVFGKYAQPIQSTITATPQLVACIELKDYTVATNTSGSFYVCLGDGSNFISGNQAYLSMLNIQYQPIMFDVFPRREREIMLNIFYRDPKGNVSLCSKIPVTNPAFRKYPAWQAESLPTTKSTGGLEVTLLGMETGHDNSSSASRRADGTEEITFGTNRLEGWNETAVMLRFKSVANTNEAWEASPLEVSDATGNIAHNFGASHFGGYSGFAFSTGLWPGETAWKLKLALKRTEGFKPEEIFAFKNVPLGELNRTNLVGSATNFGPLPITLQSIRRHAPLRQNEWNTSEESEVVFTHPDLPPGTVMDLLGVVCDTSVTNHPNVSGVSSQNGNVRLNYDFLDIPVEAKTADFIFALQSIRTVEFTVKPELPKAAKNRKDQHRK